MYKISSFWRTFIQGICIGTADIIPGVSGGTFAFVFGIYQRLVEGLSAIGPKHLAALLQLLSTKTRQEGYRKLLTIDWSLFVPLGLGVGVSVLVMSRVLPPLLETYPAQMAALFFGLVLVSCTVPAREIRWNSLLVATAVAFAGFTYLILSPNLQLPGSQNLIIVFLSGALAICSMLLPGISGSYVLVLLGQYKMILTAVRNFDFLILVPFVLGILFGLLSFSHALKWLLRVHHSLTMAALTGFMFGSLRALWPGRHIDLKLEWNSMNILLIALCLSGICILILAERLAQKVNS